MERASRKIDRNLFGDSEEDLARAAWQAVVGARIAAHTSPARLTGTTLIVDVEDRVWQRSLLALKSHILARLKEIVGHRMIEDLELRVVSPQTFARAKLPAVPDLPYRSKLGDGRIRRAVEEAAANEKLASDPLLRRLHKQVLKKAQ